MKGMDWVGQTLYGAAGGHLFRIDPVNGDITWIGTNGYAMRALAADGNKLYAIGYDLYHKGYHHALIAIDTNDGSADFITDFKTDVCVNYVDCGLEYYDGTLYLGTDRSLYSVDMGSGQLTLIGSGNYNIYSLAIVEGVMYGGGSSLFTIDMNTGQQTLISRLGYDANAIASIVPELIYYHPYDTDTDWTIDDFELLDAIDIWAAGNLDDFDLLDLIDYWAAESYCWDAGNEKHKAGAHADTGACM
jgi:hypothetical protein